MTKRLTLDSVPLRVSSLNSGLSIFAAKSFRIRCYGFSACNSFRIRSYKNKGLKVPCFHTLTKNIGGGVRAIDARRDNSGGTRPRRSHFRLLTVDCQLSALTSLTSTLTNFASVTPLTSTLTKTKDLKSFIINTYRKCVGAGSFLECGGSTPLCSRVGSLVTVESGRFRLSTVDCRLSTFLRHSATIRS
jgi:hypothetical protein